VGSLHIHIMKDFIIENYNWLLPLISFIVAGVIIPIALHILRRKSSGDNIKAIIKINKSKIRDIEQIINKSNKDNNLDEKN